MLAVRYRKFAHCNILILILTYPYIIIWKTINFKFHSSAAKREYRLAEISIIISNFFFNIIFSHNLYLLLKDLSNLFYQIAQWMLWIDNFVNPLCDNTG